MQFQMSTLTSEDSILWCFQMLSEDCATLLSALNVIYPIVKSSIKLTRFYKIEPIILCGRIGEVRHVTYYLIIMKLIIT